MISNDMTHDRNTRGLLPRSSPKSEGKIFEYATASSSTLLENHSENSKLSMLGERSAGFTVPAKVLWFSTMLEVCNLVQAYWATGFSPPILPGLPVKSQGAKAPV